MQVQDVFRMAMSKIGAVAMDETPTPGDYKLCLQNANLMLGSWSAHRLMLRGNVTEFFPLTAGTASYTIGIGDDFNTAKPLKIFDAWVRDSGNSDYPIEVVSQDQYNSYAEKITGGGIPDSLFYDPGLSQQTSPNRGTIYLYPEPSIGPYDLYIVSDKYLTAFVNLTDPVTFEDAYEEALVYNLAIRIFRDFHGIDKQIPPEVAGLAKSSRRTIEQLNHVTVTTKLDVPTAKSGYTYDGYTDTYR
jgi:hypothetical protein